jgi:hypothetical protein
MNAPSHRCSTRLLTRPCRLAVAQRIYKVNGSPLFKGSLVDGGCNGGLAGDDCVILTTHSFGLVDIIGVGDNLIKDVPLCTSAALINTSQGPIISVMHNYAALGQGETIHSPLQLQDFGVLVDDKAKSQKCIDGEFGTQTVRVMSGGTTYEIPLVLNGGLSYFKMTPPTQEQLAGPAIPHVTLTSDMPWDLSKYDNEDCTAEATPTVFGEDATAVTTDATNYSTAIDPDYDIAAFFGELQKQHDHDIDADCDDEFYAICVEDIPMVNADFQATPNIIQVMASVCRTTYESKKTWLEHKYGKSTEELRPHFALASADRIKAMVDASTQLYRSSQWSKKIK